MRKNHNEDDKINIIFEIRTNVWARFVVANSMNMTIYTDFFKLPHFIMIIFK